MHRVAATKPLGEQQARRLRQLREANDRYIHRLHLSAGAGSAGASPTERCVPRPRNASTEENRTPRSERERTVEAVIEARSGANGRSATSAATRLREKISAARSGIQTERSERSPCDADIAHRRALLPSLEARHHGSEPIEPIASGSSNEPKRMSKTRRIVAVRRQYALKSGGNESHSSHQKRRMGKDEAEWMEKQIQFLQRASALERECLNAWRSFYSSASTTSTSSPSNAPNLINKQREEIGSARTQDSRALLQQLSTLRQKATRISLKVLEMRNGTQFYSELEELIEDMEQSLSAFRESQLETYEKYVLEEGILEKAINAFVSKMESWDQNDHEMPHRSRRLEAIQSNRLREKTQSQANSNSEAANQSNNDGSYTDEPTDDELVRRVRSLNDAIMHSGGLKDGWDDRDHAIFLRELSKSGLTGASSLRRNELAQDGQSPGSNQCVHDLGNPRSGTGSNVDYETLVARFIRKCTTKLMTKTADGVRAHWRWYIGYTKLVEEKKRVVAEWKERKEKQRRELLSGTDNYDTIEEQSVKAEDKRRTKTSPDKEGGSPDDDRTAKQRARKAQRLREWKEQKRQRELEFEREKQMIEEEREAKRKQAHLSAKQQLLLYKLQQEEEASLLASAAREQATTPSPPRKEELRERSRQAIEQAKAKRAQLEALETQRKIQTTLPPRPESAKRMIETKLKESDRTAVFQATESFKARALSKQELQKKSRERKRQNAHDTYIPGGDVASEVKVKSFGHIPIQPRAIPAWRRQL